MALHDALTDLPNRRHAEAWLDHEFAAAQRGRPLTLLLLDIDHFHQFNVRNGRAAGDGVLRGVANVLRQHTRRMNISARFGPDEFLCVLSGTSEAGALTVATRIQERLRAAQSTVALPTLSIGIATYGARFLEPGQLLRAAEDALLAAKQHGRDRVRVHGRGAEALAELRAEVAGAAAFTDPLLVALSTSAPAARPGEGQLALVVHGEAEARRWLTAWLEEAGFTVQAWALPEAAIAHLTADCALAFVELAPGAPGSSDLVSELRRRAPGIRIVGVPHGAERSMDAAMLSVRVDAHVLGDGDPAALREEVRALLEERAAELESAVLSRQVTDELRASAREARLALAESEARYRGVVQSIQQVIFSADVAGRWTFLNPAWTTITGFNIEESLGQVLWEYLHPDDQETLRVEYEQLLARRGAHHVHEGQWRTRTGEYRWIEARFQAQVDIGGALIGVSGVLTDITDRRRAEAALRQHEESFRLLIENSADPIAVVNADRTIRYVSPAVQRVLGYEPSAWAQLEPIGLVHPDDVASARAAFAAVLADPETTRSAALRVRHADGSWRTLEVLLHNQLAAPGVEGVVVNARDVTRRLETEAALQRSEQQLARARRLESIGRLAGGVAHDFNNLLTAIRGHAELLLDEVRDGSGIRTDLLEIRDAAERASTLTRQLLAFSRRQVLQPRVLDLNLVVAELERVLQRTVGAHIELRTELGAPLDLVRADPAQLEQVLLNLVLNARDALAAGGHIRVRTANHYVAAGAPETAEDLAPGNYVTLQVEDDGTGMAGEVAQQAFEPFFTTKRPGAGTGLGLSTVYGVIKQSGGHVTLTSTPGVGTTATIFLPSVAPPQESADAAETQPSAEWHHGGETVLVAEDESSVRELARRILEKQGYTVLAAGTGREALALQETHAGPIHLLLTDVVMPEMAGPELAARMTELRPETRVLFMSGYAEEAIAGHGALAGRPLLEKPFAPEELLRRVRAALSPRA
jgi:diguanylate cyclase (GGDEF)-like protein/PAS domain S-box-containing protein